MTDRPLCVSASLREIPETVPVRVAFFANNGKWGRLIRWRTWADVPSHVGLLTADGKNILHSREKVGVCIQPLEESAPAGSIIIITEALVPAPAARTIWRLAEEQIGKKYDWMGNIGFVLRRNMHGKDRWFCSELVAWLFWKAGHPLLHRVPSWKHSPEDLWRSPHLRIVESLELVKTKKGPIRAIPVERILSAPERVSLKSALRYLPALKNQNAEKCRAFSRKTKRMKRVKPD